MTHSFPGEEDIFRIACELTGDARDAYLEQVCSHDEALKERLKTLLRADEQQPKLGVTEDIEAQVKRSSEPSQLIGPTKSFKRSAKEAWVLSIWRNRRSRFGARSP